MAGAYDSKTGEVASGAEAEGLIARAEAEGRTIYRQGHGVHVESYPGVGLPHVVMPPPSEPRTLEAVAEILAESPDPGRTARYLKIAVNLISRDAIRQLREIRLELLPGWLDEDPPLFVFPAWGPAWRPFDWAVDA